MESQQHNFYDDSDEDDQQPASKNSDDNPRWDEEALKDMDFVCTFLDNEEDTLPELFDFKKVKKQQADLCALCERHLGRISKLGAGPCTKRHHCRKCGSTVCSLCSNQKRRLCKVDKKKYRVCDVCDTLMSNVNFESMYEGCIRQ